MPIIHVRKGRASAFTRILLVISALLALSIPMQPALAHGYIVRAIPEDRAILERAPVRVQYWFSEGLEPEFSSLTVRDQTGKVIATGGVAPDNDTLLTVRLPRGLPDGAYIADMRLAFASDGHVVAVSRVFFVGQAVSGVAGQTATNEANLLEIVWRALVFSSTMLLFGAFTLYSLVLVPAWGNPTYRAGLLPPRVMRALNWTIIVALVLTFTGNILAILQQAMAFFNVDLSQVISQNLWIVVRTGTRFGDVWNARLLLFLLVATIHGLSLFFWNDQPETVRPFWVANAWGMALVIGTFSAASHAAGSLLWPWLGIMMDWLHAAAVGLWAGGLMALVLVLPAALTPYEGEARRLALVVVLRHFSRLAVAGVVLVVTTGIYSAVNWINTPAEVVQTSFGSTLVFKLALVAGLLLVGLVHHVALQPERYQRWTAVIQRVQDFLPTLRLEAILVLLVLTAAGLLSATPVPVPAFAQQSVPAPHASQTVGNWTINQSITPGGPGVNTYDTLITRGGQPVDGLTVRTQVVSPLRDQRGPWKSAEDADSGLYVATGDEIDQAGQWWTLVDITGPNDQTTRVAFNWTIREDAAVIQTRPPGIINLLALLGVLASSGWVLYPAAKKLYDKLDLRPTTVAIAVGVVVVTIGFILGGSYVIQDTQTYYDAALNPLPTVVNSVLPDKASLERGRTLYAQACSWNGLPDLDALKERLPRTRDDELFSAVLSGWQTLPPCDQQLTNPQRWDVVNFIRTFEKPTASTG